MYDQKHFGSGLINNTWKVIGSENGYILQRINQAVFKTPDDIAQNINLFAGFLKREHREYKFVAPVTSLGGSEMIYVDRE
ncbi:MAG: hypothetical protein ABIS01_12085 [Ferruginibacter sp.]